MGYSRLWYWQKDRHIGQWDKLENPRQTQTRVSDKGAKKMHWGKDSIFNECAGAIGHSQAKDKNKTKQKTPKLHILYRN